MRCHRLLDVSSEWAGILINVVALLLAIPGTWVAFVQIHDRRSTRLDTQPAPAPPPVATPVQRPVPAPPAGAKPPTANDPFRKASRALAVTALIIPVMTLTAAVLNIRISGTTGPGYQTKELGILILPAAFVSLGFVVLTIPVVMGVANGRRWAIKVADVLCTVIEYGSLGVTILFVIAAVVNVLHAVGIDVAGGGVVTGNPVIGTVFLLVVAGVSWLIFRLSMRARDSLAAARKANV